MLHRISALLMLLACCLATAHSRAATYCAAINTNGSDGPLALSSGTLPGTNPDAAGAAPALQAAERLPPRSYERQFPRAGRQPSPLRRQALPAAGQPSCSTGQQQSFWIDDAGGAWRLVAATCRAVSAQACIFVDDSLTIDQDTLELYGREFDLMHAVVADNIGTSFDLDGNGKVTALLYDIQDGGTTFGYIAGYFWQKDYEAQTLINHSNEADMIYLRGNPPAGWSTIASQYGDFFTFNLTTLAHEYAHMAVYGTLVASGGSSQTPDVWIDEMIALAAETMYFKEKLRRMPGFTHPDMLAGGYLVDRVKYYSQDPGLAIRNGHGLTYWDYTGQVLANYSLAYLMGQYLSLHAVSGQKIFKAVLGFMLTHGVFDYQAVEAVAALQLAGIDSWDDLMRNWAAANLLGNFWGPAGYKGAFRLEAHGPTNNPAQLHHGGVVYRQVDAREKPADADPYLAFYFFTSGAVYPWRPYCAAKYVLGENHPAIAGLYELRNRVAAGTGAGSILAALYYRHTAEITRLLAADPRLRNQARSLLFELVPLSHELAQQGTVVAPADLVSRCLDLLDSLADRGSPSLRQDLGGIVTWIRYGSMLGQLGIEAR